MNTQPILLSVFYTLREGHTASVRVVGESDPHTLLTLVHTAIGTPGTGHIHSFTGDEASPRFPVADRDVLVLIAQRLVVGKQAVIHLIGISGIVTDVLYVIYWECSLPRWVSGPMGCKAYLSIGAGPHKKPCFTALPALRAAR